MHFRSRLLVVLILGVAGLTAQDTRREETVGTLDFFGLRRVAETDVRAALKLKEGDPFERSAAKAIVAELEKLSGMTASGAAGLLRTLRARALPELIEIARWKSEGHAFPAIRILGRIAGWKDERTLRTWRDGGLEKIVAAATAAK